MSSSRTTTCPFCGLSFQRLGAHLPRCNKRNGRNYSVFLSKRAVESKPGGGVCPKCGCRFKCLDTRLRRSASCRTIASRENPKQRGAASPCTALPPMNNTSQSGVTTAPQPADHISPQDAHIFKRPLKLPRAVEEWEEA